MNQNFKLVLVGVVSSIIAASLASYAGEGGTHVTTDVQHKTVTKDRNTTRVRTVHETNPVEDVTHVRDVTRVHPIHHITDVTRVLHHTIRKDTDENETHRTVAPEQVEHTESTEEVGTPAEPHEHTVTRYHDVYKDDYETRVHEVTGAPAIDHEIHRHVTELTVQPIVHEHDITRVKLDNVHKHRTEVERVTVAGAARTIVKHKREDVDP